MILKKEKSNSFARRALLLVMAILLVTALGGLGLVWLRQETAIAADRGQAYEKEIASLERRLHLLDSKIATVHQPDFLKELVRQRGLPLTAPQGFQTVHLSTPRKTESIAGDELAESLFSSYDLALFSIESRLPQTE